MSASVKGCRAATFVAMCVLPIGVWAADVTSTWNGGSGDWDVDGNWTNAPLLGGFPNDGNGGVAAYDAVVDAGGGPYTVTLDLGITVEDLTIDSADATVNHTACSFTATGAIELLDGEYRVDGGSIVNTTINQAGGR